MILAHKNPALTNIIQRCMAFKIYLAARVLFLEDNNLLFVKINVTIATFISCVIFKKSERRCHAESD